MPKRTPATTYLASYVAWAMCLAIVAPNTAIAADQAGKIAAAEDVATQAAPGRRDARQQPDTSPAHVQELVHQLGNPRYTVRRSAANELRQIGAEAFDLLHSATNDPDPEVAATARYLLRQISVRWVRSDDSPSVRRLLLDFGDQPDGTRLLRIAQLSVLPNGEGIAGLCRVARFDRSPLISREAAIAIIRPDELKSRSISVDPDTIDAELGPSTRVASTWLHQYVRQQRDPASAVDGWQKLIDEETARLNDHTGDTSSAVVLGLLWNTAEVYRQLNSQQAVLSVIDRMLAIDEDLYNDTSIELLTWLREHKSWDTLDAFLAKHQNKIEQNKKPLYFIALARAEQGQADVAEQLAERAVGLEPQSQLESFWMAKELEERNKFDWAVREYRHVIDKQAIDARAKNSHEAILCRIYLANLLFDYEKYEKAADTLEPLVKAMQGDDRVKQLYAEIARYHLRRRESFLVLPESEAIPCRYHFYRACQYHEAKDWQRERDELTLAIQFDKTDADVLIAMYRVPESKDEWKASTLKRIRDLAQTFQQTIDESPNDPSAYNQWAWLIANTEGDYQKAIRYSHRSIELIPPGAGESASASFLDTLGRCYFAAGDYENALKYERQAVAKVDYMQVMQRQLALFEKTLAEKQGSTSAPPPPSAPKN